MDGRVNIERVQDTNMDLMRRVVRRAWHEIERRTLSDTNRDLASSMFVAGTPRSGTTWLAEVIARSLQARIVFEPFYPEKVADFRGVDDWYYLNPADSSDDFRDACRRALSGQIRGRWVDQSIVTRHPRCRLIKAVRANLFLRWLNLQFPDVPMLFLTRHPCAVVFSRIKCGWGAGTAIRDMLSKPDLVRDHLEEYLGTIHDARSVESQHAVIWCIHHLVPFRQFESKPLRGAFYEKLRADPENEWPRAFAALGRPYSADTLRFVQAPSSTSSLSGSEKQLNWRTQMKPRQIEDVLTVVRRFGLGHIYSDEIMPCGDPFSIS